MAKEQLNNTSDRDNENKDKEISSAITEGVDIGTIITND